MPISWALSDGVGSSVSGAGDVDGDGHDDLLIGAPWNNEGGRRGGAAYLVSGPVTGTFDLALADAKLVGGENMRDWAVGASRAQGTWTATGTTTCWSAQTTPVPPDPGPRTWCWAPLRARSTCRLPMPSSWAKRTGTRRAGVCPGAGDVDADGHDDLLVGAIYDDEGAATGRCRLSGAWPRPGTLDLSAASAKLVGEEMADIAGVSVSGAGDVDSDGHDDMLVGATGNDEGGTPLALLTWCAAL